MAEQGKTPSPVWSEDAEINDFCNELLGAVREMEAGKGSRRTEVEVS